VPLAAGGLAVSAWWLAPGAPQRPGAGGAEEPAPRTSGDPHAPLVLMLHGNGENLETMRQAGLFEDFRRAGAGVLAIDYPGYGRSEGTPSEQANLAAAEAAWSWLREHVAGGGGGGGAGGRPSRRGRRRHPDERLGPHR